MSSTVQGLGLKYGNRKLLEPSGHVQYCSGIGLEICEPQAPGTLWACPVLFRVCFTFTVTINSTTQGLNFIYPHTQIAIVAVNMHHHHHHHHHHQSYLSPQHLRSPLPGSTHRPPYESHRYVTCHGTIYACLHCDKLNPVIYARHGNTVVVFGSMYLLKF